MFGLWLSMAANMHAHALVLIIVYFKLTIMVFAHCRRSNLVTLTLIVVHFKRCVIISLFGSIQWGKCLRKVLRVSISHLVIFVDTFRWFHVNLSYIICTIHIEHTLPLVACSDISLDLLTIYIVSIHMSIKIQKIVCEGIQMLHTLVRKNSSQAGFQDTSRGTLIHRS